jgi:ABC-type Fe3+/spermidine/putrescine transport system ATPase subunit
VLEHGRVAQIGTADDLFHQPRTRFVAEFIGKTNVVDGRAVGTDRVAHGPLTLRVAGGGLTPGAPVALSIRPHQIEIVAPTDPDAVRGTVQRVSFLGEAVDYQVAVADSDVVVRVTASSLKRLRPGEPVGLRVDPSACVVLADDREAF